MKNNNVIRLVLKAYYNVLDYIYKLSYKLLQ